jgi:heat shock protein HslJ
MKKLVALLVIILVLQSCKEEKTYYIADHYGDNGALLYRSSPDEDWKIFEGKLEGFTYEEGYEYKVKVQIDKQDDKLYYKLLSVESKKQTDYLQRMEELHAGMNKVWQLTSLKGVLVPENLPYFKIQGNEISGFSGCNKFFGGLKYDLQGHFVTHKIAGTKKACPNMMETEHAMYKALSSARHYSLSEGVLEVFDEKKSSLFKAVAKSENTALDGKWIVTGIEGFLNTTGMYPEFVLKGNTISGNTGCNDFNGTLNSIGEGKFTTGDIMTTKKLCPRTMKVEKAFLNALRNTASYKTEKDLIHFFDTNGKLLFSAMSRK